MLIKSSSQCQSTVEHHNYATEICVSQKFHMALIKAIGVWCVHTVFQLFGEEAATVSSVLLCLGRSPAGDPWPGI